MEVSEQMARSPHRFNDLQIEEQKALALRSRLGGATWPEVAQRLSDESPDGLSIDRQTARRRYLDALTDFRVPRDEWQTYRDKQLAELELAVAKVVSALLAWQVGIDDARQLVGLTGGLVRLQDRSDTVVGFPTGPLAPPSTDGGARDYALNMVTNPEAHSALLSAMSDIKRTYFADQTAGK